MSFIPLIRDGTLISSEASLKYFLTQALASRILLFSFILIIISRNYSILNIEYRELNFTNLIIFSRLLLKTGAAPFHFWFPNIIEGLSWINCFILITWQKIAPFILISYLITNNLVIISAILSVIFGALGGLNQSILRKLIAYSSINHIGWIIRSLILNQNAWILYFLFYSFLSFNLIFIFNLWKIFHLNKIFSLFTHLKSLKFVIIFNLLSLGGLPPFLGFLPKWILINLFTINNQLLLSFILILFTLITLYFYLRICYAGFILSHYELRWINNFSINNFQLNLYIISSSISILGLPLIRLIYFIL